MEWYEAEVQNLERLQASNPLPAGCILFYGSSSIRLWTTLEQDFPGLPVVNRGFGGSTMAACSWFFWRLVLPLKPRALVVYAGDNDLGDGQPPAEVLRQFGFLASQIDEFLGCIPFAFISIKPSPARWHLRNHICEVNAAIEHHLHGRPNGLFINVFEKMLSRGYPQTEFFATDGLHLSPAGYRLWKEVLWSYREQLFGIS
jgi:lysophospholipase L1-like esterase